MKTLRTLRFLPGLRTLATALGALCALAALAACTPADAQLKTLLNQAAEPLKREFSAVDTALTAYGQALDALHSQKPLESWDTQGLDVEQGGPFASFEGGRYYYKPEAEGSSYYASPNGPVPERMRREFRRLLEAEPLQAQAYGASPLISAVFFGRHEPDTIAQLYPWFDVVSTFPPGVPLLVFDWYRRGLASAGGNVWSPQPFTDLATGWVVDVARPVRGPAGVEGVAVISVSMRKLAQQHLLNTNSALLLLGQDGTLVAASARAKQAWDLKELGDFDFVRQMRENQLAAEEFRLSHPSQAEGLRQIAERLSAPADPFLTEVEGRSVWIAVQALEPSPLLLAGFLEP